MDFEVRCSIWDLGSLHDRETDLFEFTNVANELDDKGQLSDLRRRVVDELIEAGVDVLNPQNSVKRHQLVAGAVLGGVTDLLIPLFVTHQFLETR